MGAVRGGVSRGGRGWGLGISLGVRSQEMPNSWLHGWGAMDLMYTNFKAIIHPDGRSYYKMFVK